MMSIDWIHDSDRRVVSRDLHKSVQRIGSYVRSSQTIVTNARLIKRK